jgi:hypothetical protein
MLIRGYKRTLTMSTPPADAVPEAGNAHIVGSSSVLDQNAVIIDAPAPAEGPRVLFALTLSVPAKVPDLVYIPTNISVALVEFNDSTAASGALLEIRAFSDFLQPGDSNTTLTWNSTEVQL